MVNHLQCTYLYLDIMYDIILGINPKSTNMIDYIPQLVLRHLAALKIVLELYIWNREDVLISYSGVSVI